MCNHFPNLMFLSNQKNPPFYRYNVYCAAHMSQKLPVVWSLICRSCLHSWGWLCLWGSAPPGLSPHQTQPLLPIQIGNKMLIIWTSANGFFLIHPFLRWYTYNEEGQFSVLHGIKVAVSRNFFGPFFPSLIQPTWTPDKLAKIFLLKGERFVFVEIFAKWVTPRRPNFRT